MKIIVDEMPETSRECLFSKYDGCYQCILGTVCIHNGSGCEYLQPITDHHVEKIVDPDRCIVSLYSIR